MLKLAYVRDNADPDGMARILVEYLGHDAEARSDWMPVATPLAGDEAGLFVLPEVGDMVAVGFVNGDINRPIMLGAIWNGAQTPPAEAHTERRFVSRTGHSITLSDGDDDGITLADTHDNIITMNADGITIETAGDLTITVGGDTTFETGGEATHTASTIKLNP
ncbi:MAG: hypothetical protein GVY31_11860 [Alphaproteobacteria bacterium]|jgi:uncharacterized protein involved in type VI secretion and phage assembly|nr:hypothetical protein [Alphaproteobacteria bacterium]